MDPMDAVGTAARGPLIEHGAPENSNIGSNLGKGRSPAAPNFVRLGEVRVPVDFGQQLVASLTHSRSVQASFS